MKKILLVAHALLLAGCLTTSPDTSAWNMVKDVNSQAAYEDFIRRYPDSGYVEDAREMIEDAKMDRIMKASTVAECVQTIKTNPEPEIAATVADLAFKAARSETSVEPLYDFLFYFKTHSGAPEIRERLEEIEFKGASEDASPLAMEYFLLRYPESRFAGEGRKLLSQKSYKQVKAWKSQYGFKAFLLKFPESSYAAEVRGLILPAQVQPGTSNGRERLADVIEQSPWLKRYACALSLSASIREKSGDVDRSRRQLYEIEKGGASGTLPECCSAATLVVKPGVGGDVNEVLMMMEKTEERRRELANIWEVYRQRDDMARTAAETSSKVADDLEAAELSEEVLGSGPLGALDIGREKGSMSARKAFERFKLAGKSIEKNRDDIKRLLIEMDSLYRPLKLYLTSCLIAGGKP